MKNITVLGIDLAKDVFQLHGINEHGKKILGKKVTRSALPTLIAQLPKCKIVMEACGSSNYWSRKFMSYGHEVLQISPQHVKPFVQGNKNDKNDARAIVIASQQEIQMLHRYRESLVHDRTALGNRMRGYLREVGLFLVVGLSQVRKQVPSLLEDAENELTTEMREILSNCHKKLLDLDQEIECYTQKIERFCKQNPVCERLM